jgi:hypothetical protein
VLRYPSWDTVDPVVFDWASINPPDVLGNRAASRGARPVGARQESSRRRATMTSGPLRGASHRGTGGASQSPG